jgi:hypothetical protein
MSDQEVIDQETDRAVRRPAIGSHGRGAGHLRQPGRARDLADELDMLHHNAMTRWRQLADRPAKGA